MRKQGRITETTTVDVAFYDVDLMAIVWHGHYLKYLENARWTLMNRIGYGFEAMKNSGFLWPIIEAHLRYVRPARFGDRLAVAASLVEWENRVAINYLITDAATKTRIARGRTVQVAVDTASGELQYESPRAFVSVVEQCLASIGGRRA